MKGPVIQRNFKSYGCKVRYLCKIIRSSHQRHTMLSNFYGDMQYETDIWVILEIELSCFQKIDVTLKFLRNTFKFQQAKYNIFAYNCY